LQDVKNAIEWAKKLDVPRIILLSGNEQPGLSREEQYASLVEGAKRATELAAMNEAEPYTAVYHVADAPGRHDPGSGKMKWENIYEAIGKSGYFRLPDLRVFAAGRSGGEPHQGRDANAQGSQWLGRSELNETTEIAARRQSCWFQTSFISPLASCPLDRRKT
jgi:sugar phosphate isomerase/epimerase